MTLVQDPLLLEYTILSAKDDPDIVILVPKNGLSAVEALGDTFRAERHARSPQTVRLVGQTSAAVLLPDVDPDVVEKLVAGAGVSMAVLDDDPDAMPLAICQSA